MTIKEFLQIGNVIYSSSTILEKWVDDPKTILDASSNIIHSVIPSVEQMVQYGIVGSNDLLSMARDRLSQIDEIIYKCKSGKFDIPEQTIANIKFFRAKNDDRGFPHYGYILEKDGKLYYRYANQFVPFSSGDMYVLLRECWQEIDYYVAEKCAKKHYGNEFISIPMSEIVYEL